MRATQQVVRLPRENHTGGKRHGATYSILHPAARNCSGLERNVNQFGSGRAEVAWREMSINSGRAGRRGDEPYLTPLEPLAPASGPPLVAAASSRRELRLAICGRQSARCPSRSLGRWDRLAAIEGQKAIVNLEAEGRHRRAVNSAAVASPDAIRIPASGQVAAGGLLADERGFQAASFHIFQWSPCN